MKNLDLLCLFFALIVLSVFVGCADKEDELKITNKFDNLIGDYGGAFILVNNTNPHSCWNNGPQNAKIEVSGDEIHISINTIFGESIQGGWINTKDISYDAATKKWVGSGNSSGGSARFNFDETTNTVYYSFSNSSFNFNFSGIKGKSISSEYVKIEDLKKLEGKYKGTYILKTKRTNGSYLTQTGIVENYIFSVDSKGKVTITYPNLNGGNYTYDYKYNSLEYYPNGIKSRYVCPTLTDYLDYSNGKLKLKNIDRDYNSYEKDYELTKY